MFLGSPERAIEASVRGSQHGRSPLAPCRSAGISTFVFQATCRL